MAKAEVAVKENNLPAHIAGAQVTGAGVSTDQSDMLIPMLKILQALSPEVEKKGAEYVPGAEPGMILIKNAPNPLIDGEKGFLFQHVASNKAIVEWVPRDSGGGGGQGFVATYETMPASMVMAPSPTDPKKKIAINKDNGNLLVETRYHAGYIIDPEGKAAPMPAVIPFSSTGHTVAKGWNFLMAQQMVGNKVADSWFVYYQIKTKLRSKGTQRWYILDITNAGPVDKITNRPTVLWAPTQADLDRGKALYTSLASGKVKMEQGVAEDGGAEEDDGKM